MDLSELKKIFLSKLNESKQVAFDLNYDLADHPEISGQEFRSAKRFVDICREHGLEVEENFCSLPTAFRAHALRKDKAKYKMAILAEYDALPGLGHGCGHSASGAISLLTALSLSKMGEYLDVDIDLVGTPDEESRGEKIKMANDGIFKDYSFAMMIHLTSDVTMPSLRLLALSVMNYKFYGVPSHASANPWDGKNALNGAMLAIHAMDMMRGHLTPQSRIANFIKDGGEAHNTVPKYADVETCLRHTTKKGLEHVKRVVDDCVQGAAIATQTTAEKVMLGYECTDMLINETGVNIIRDILNELNVPYKEDDDSMQGSSDIANVSYECPTFHPLMATSTEHFSLHSEDMVRMMKSEEIKDKIVQGATLIGFTMLNIIQDKDKMNAMIEEFKKSKKAAEEHA